MVVIKCVELHWYITLVYVNIPYIIRKKFQRRNYIISKKDFVKEKMTEKLWGKINCYEFVKSVSYKLFT